MSDTANKTEDQAPSHASLPQCRRGSGRLSVDTVMKNLRKRPASEHRRLLNRGMQDVIERALSVASEELDDAELETMLEAVAGYQQRLGV